MSDRLEIDEGESIPTTLDGIRAGDWVASDWTMGQVVARVQHRALGAGFIVRTPRGAQEFMPEAEARILGYWDCRPHR